MSESGDYDPGPWQGDDFKSAKATYDAHVGRSYDAAVSKKVTAVSKIENQLRTNSPAPVVIVCDVTGSMGEWPAVIFSKLPYLDIEGKTYLGKDMKISFAAVGDVYSDQYPLQVRPFAEGLELKTRLSELIIEKNGGGQQKESYDVAALYYARKCQLENAVNPIMIFIGDEGLYETVDVDLTKAKCAFDELEKISTAKVFEELKRKFSVYLVWKAYSADDGSSVNSTIRKQWEALLGEDHVCTLADASRVVDVIFGIFAKETGKIDYFKKEITGRQTTAQVNTVMKSLATVHRIPAGKSLKKLPYASVSRSRKGDDEISDESLFD